MIGPAACCLHRALSLADSVALDPHKALQCCYGVSALMVRKGARLREAFTPEPVHNGASEPVTTRSALRAGAQVEVGLACGASGKGKPVSDRRR